MIQIAPASQRTLSDRDLDMILDLTKGFIMDAVRTIWKQDIKTSQDRWREWERLEEFCVEAFDRAIRKHRRVLAAIAMVQPEQLNARKKFEEERKRLRSETARDLKQSRNQLRLMKEEISLLAPLVNHLRRGVESAPLPPIPDAEFCEPNEQGVGLPDGSGIYFVWSQDVVVYVGQSSCIKNRLRLGTHHALVSGDRISFLPMDKAGLNFAESYYIWIAKPVRNFGGAKRIDILL